MFQLCFILPEWTWLYSQVAKFSSDPGRRSHVIVPVMRSSSLPIGRRIMEPCRRWSEGWEKLYLLWVKSVAVTIHFLFKELSRFHPQIFRFLINMDHKQTGKRSGQIFLFLKKNPTSSVFQCKHIDTLITLKSSNSANISFYFWICISSLT